MHHAEKTKRPATVCVPFPLSKAMYIERHEPCAGHHRTRMANPTTYVNHVAEMTSLGTRFQKEALAATSMCRDSLARDPWWRRRTRTQERERRQRQLPVDTATGGIRLNSPMDQSRPPPIVQTEEGSLALGEAVRRDSMPTWDTQRLARSSLGTVPANAAWASFLRDDRSVRVPPLPGHATRDPIKRDSSAVPMDRLPRPRSVAQGPQAVWRIW